MNTVLAAIKQAYDASPLVESTGGLFYGRVFDRQLPPPYVTYTIVSGVSDNDMSSIVDDVVVQMSAWSAKRSPVEVLAVAKQLWATYDNAVLTAEGYTIIRIDRLSFNLIPDPDTQGWQVQTDYRITLQQEQ